MSETTYRQRNPARRVFAWEYKDATFEKRDGDSDEAPRYLLLPTGSWANRVFVIGTLAQVVDNPEQEGYVHGELQDPTGRFTIDAGEYQPEAVQALKRIEPPEMVAVTGKAVRFEGEQGSGTKITATTVNPVPEPLYDHWVADTATKTLERLKHFGDDDNEAAEVAANEYGTELMEYRDAAIDAVTRVQDLIREDQNPPGNSAEANTD